jgi:hypothetical protein
MTDNLTNARRLLNWLPVDALLVDGRQCVKWMDVAGVSLDEPLFDQTFERLRRERPDPAEIVTGFETLIQLEKISDSVRPSGFIFHSSRCGSTLLANACRALPGSIVVSEAPIVEKIIGRFFSYLDTDGAQITINSIFLRAAVSALGQRRLGTEQSCFVKFSCLSVLQFERVRRIWPEVPCVFMFRDPREVMVSNLGNPPAWMLFESLPEQAATVTGVEAREALQMSSEEVCARALNRFYRAGAELAASGALLIDYDELSVETLSRAVEFFGFTLTGSDRERISRTAQLYSKDSSLGRRFEPDSERKRTAVSPRVSDAAERWSIGPYLRLKEIQKQGSALGPALAKK